MARPAIVGPLALAIVFFLLSCTAEPTPDTLPTLAPETTPTLTSTSNAIPTATPVEIPEAVPTQVPAPTATIAPTVTPTQVPAPTATTAPTITPTAGPTVTPTPLPVAATEPRAMVWLEQLFTDMPHRRVDTPEDLLAAEYLARRFRETGYTTSVVEFEYSYGRSMLTVDGESVDSEPFDMAPSGDAEGRLVPSGLGYPEQFPEGIEGNIALIERGELFFYEKINYAQYVGAKGVVIYNNRDGMINGVAENALLPTVGISRRDGELLLQKDSPVAEIQVEEVEGHSYNVVAHVPGKEDCGGRVIIGAHYDTWEEDQPTRNDNASGLGVLLALSERLAVSPPECGVDLVGFGAQITPACVFCGGSAYLDLQPDPLVMVSLDALGVGERLVLEGSPGLLARVGPLANELGIDHEMRELDDWGRSEDSVFRESGVPAMHVGANDDTALSPAINSELLDWATQLAYELAQERW